jgi:bisphosphoglycerate-dependent phosphoglycerate mutase
LAQCDPDVNYDPWIGSTGEVPYWVRNQRTKVIPFTTATPAESQYGYLQVTTFEALRDKYSEDIFHIWFSETPNGPPLDGVKCEYYAQQAKLNLYWTQQDKYADQVCFLGTTARTLYVNAETRCSPRHYKGTCDEETLHKSKQSYNFDVSRRTQ